MVPITYQASESVKVSGSENASIQWSSVVTLGSKYKH